MNPHFNWEHAEHPEASAIDDKVLRLFEGKNVFIGICTRKELVVSPSALKDGKFIFSGHRYAKDQDYVWKTSDWIIQEIGLAVGRGLHVILLVEDGVRSPGGIQGSLEYIPFNRSRPEESFERLLQMVAALSSAIPEGMDALAGSSAPASVENEGGVSNWFLPDHTWSIDQYEIAFMHYTAIDDIEKAASIEKAFYESAGSTPSEKEAWPAFAEYMKIQFGRAGRIEKIASMARQSLESPAILKYLALSYKALGEDLKAAEIFVEASSCESVPKVKIELLVEAVSSAAEKDPAFAENVLVTVREIAARDVSLRSAALSAEKYFSKARKENGFFFASMEQLLEHSPDDHSMRFDLAYAYSDAGMADMALFHYLRIPYKDRSEVAWNNLGVAYENQKLPISSITAYKKSKAMGGTLAASNMAYRLLRSGFLDEARDICESALGVKDHHKNVDAALSQVKDSIEKERDAERGIITSAQEVSGFYRRMGEALVSDDAPNPEGAWMLDGAEFVINIDGVKFTARGSILESPSSVRLRSVFATDEKPEPYDVKIDGTIRGRAVYGTYEKKRRSSGNSLVTILGGDEKEAVILFFSNDPSRIEIMRGGGDKRKVSMIRRLDKLSSSSSIM